MHALADYGVMQCGSTRTSPASAGSRPATTTRCMVNGRYLMAPSPIPKFDNPKMDMSPALQLFGAGREKRIYAMPPYTTVKSLDFEDHPFEVAALGPALRALRRRPTAISTRWSPTTGAGGCSSARTPTTATSRQRPRGATRRERARRCSSVEGLTKRFGARVGCRRCRLRALAGRGAGGGRRVRLRQDDAARTASPACCRPTPARVRYATRHEGVVDVPASREPRGAGCYPHRMGLRAPEPARRAAARRHGRRPISASG